MFKLGKSILLLVLAAFLLLMSGCSSDADQINSDLVESQYVLENTNSETNNEEEQNETNEYSKELNPEIEQTDVYSDGVLLSYGQCVGTEKPLLTDLPMNLDDFSFIIPYGLMAGGHVTPIDHQYFSPTDFHSSRDSYPVYAMADATIVDISERTTSRGVEYRLVFSISCSLFYYYDLVTSLESEIESIYESTDHEKLNIPVTGGELIGYIGGQTLDFAVWDMDVTLSGFVVPEHYVSELWKIHTVDPLEYYSEELKDLVLSKYIRSVEPISGKIDYDIDGKLVGNWFEESYVGYVPTNLEPGENYWIGHLSFVYDNYDPTSIVVSIGDYDGEASQFGVKGNGPDPSSIDSTSGMIKYELVQQDWIGSDGNYWDRFTLDTGIQSQNHDEQVQGTLHVQMIDDRTIQVEVFVNQLASEITAFTSNKKIYTR